MDLMKILKQSIDDAKKGTVKPEMSTAIPRRMRIDRMVPAELAITNAMYEVEKMGADVLLTDAVILLSQAREKVFDYVDSHKDGEGEMA